MVRLSILILQVVVQLMGILRFNQYQLIVHLLLQHHPVPQYQVVTVLLEQDLLNSVLLLMEHLLAEDLDLGAKWIQTIQHNLLK